MGKTQSREGGLQEAYLVHPAPTRYDLEGYRVVDNDNFVLQRPTTPLQVQTFGRTRSQYSLQPSEVSMASSKYHHGLGNKLIIEKKASYLGRFQTQALTETALANLRTVIRQSQLKKTKIKLSVNGISFGTKTKGVLQPDKVAYRFIDFSDLESLHLDSVNNDVLLCISRISNQQTALQNGQTTVIYTQNYEINTFYVDLKDAKALEVAFANFQNKVTQKENVSREVLWRSRSVPLASPDSVDHTPVYRAPVADSRAWILTTDRNRDIRTATVDRTRVHTMDRPKDKVHTTNNGNTTTRPSYVYNGAMTTERSTHTKKKQRHAEASANLPGPSGPVSPSSATSMTTRVYFDEKDGPAMADVECQVNPKASTSSTQSATEREVTRTSRSSSLSHNRKDSFKRRIEDLSREMDKIKTLLDEEEMEVTTNVAESRSTSSSGSSSSRHHGQESRTQQTTGDAVAGTINTKAGTVDVVVDRIPNGTKPRNKSSTSSGTSTHTQVRKGRHSSYSSNTAQGRIQSNGVRQNGVGPGPRYIYYRPVTPDQVVSRGRVEGSRVVYRPRSTEPPRVLQSPAKPAVSRAHRS